MMNTPEDESLIRAIASGDTQAMEKLYAKYGPGVLNFLSHRLDNRQLAEEVLQDVMLAVWKSAKTFRGESKVLTWLLTIARNRAINAQRRKHPALVTYEEEIGMATQEAGPLERIEQQYQSMVVRQAMDYLPEAQREILVMVFYHQLKGAEIAEILGISEGTVKSRLHRAKDTLRRILQSEENL